MKRRRGRTGKTGRKGRGVNRKSPTGGVGGSSWGRGVSLVARVPELHDVRGEHHLLVWGDLGQWLVVDEELGALLAGLDGERTLRDVLKDHARRFRKPFDAVEAEAKEALTHLEQRGIVSSKPSKSSRGQGDPEPISIANITINLTNRCNLKCGFCYNAKRRTPERPIHELMDAIERGKEVIEHDASLIILGGEPFFDPDRLFAALDRASELFEPASLVSTNGTLLTPAVVEQIAKRRVEVQVSIDSYDPTQHDATRGAGTHAKAVSSVGRLVEAGVHTIMSMVYDSRSFEAIEQYLDLAKDLGVDEARLIPMRLIGGGLDLKDSIPNQRDVFEHLLDVLARRPELRSLLGRDFFSIITAICRTSAHRTSCGIGRRVVFIDADGKVYPCPNHVEPDHCCGDLATTDLATIVRSSPVLASMRERYHIQRYRACRECPFRHWCAGDCRGEVLAVEGDPNGDSPHCAELKEVYLKALWLLAEGDERLNPSRAPSNERAAKNFFQ